MQIRVLVPRSLCVARGGAADGTGGACDPSSKAFFLTKIRCKPKLQH
jgi:hypothetical protein